MLLAGVYVELLGERQATLVFAGNGAPGPCGRRPAGPRSGRRRCPPCCSREEEIAHREFVKTLGRSRCGCSIWARRSGEVGLRSFGPDPTYVYVRLECRRVAPTSSCTMPGSVMAWPASGTMRSSASGQTRVRSQAFFTGVTTS